MAGKLKQYYKGPARKVVIKNNYANKRISVKAYGRIKVKKVSNEYRKPSNQTLSKKFASANSVKTNRGI